MGPQVSFLLPLPEGQCQYRSYRARALHLEEEALYQKQYHALGRMKDHKPELFHISTEEQIAKITVQLAGSFLRWLVSE